MATSPDHNVRWVNDAVASDSAVENSDGGSGGYFYTTSSPTGTAPSNVAVKFEFLQAQLSSLGPIAANFFVDITVTSTPATALGVFRLQDIPSGSFSFTSTQAVMVGATTYAAGSNLLTGTFNTGLIFGTGTSGSLSGNTTDGTLTFSSDFLTFTATTERNYAMALTAITPDLFGLNNGTALRSFRALATGSFSSDDAPVVNGVPEPQIWGLMVVGFGLIGVQVRRRSRQSAVAA